MVNAALPLRPYSDHKWANLFYESYIMESLAILVASIRFFLLKSAFLQSTRHCMLDFTLCEFTRIVVDITILS